MEKNTTKILFNKQALPHVLEIFGKGIDKDGFIINSDSGEYVRDPEGQPILSKELGGIKKGSEIFLKNDIVTLLNLAEGKY